MKSTNIPIQLFAAAGAMGPDYSNLFLREPVSSPFNPPRNTGARKAMRAAKKRRNRRARQPK